MASNELPASYAKIRIPSWLFGGDPAGLLKYSRMRSRRIGTTDAWSVQTEERYLHRPPSLVTVEHLAGPLVEGQSFDVLNSVTTPAQVRVSAENVEKVNRLGAQIQESGRLVDALTHMQLSLMVAPDDQFASMVEQVHVAITEIGTQSDPSKKILANASAHFIRRDPVMLHRMKFASVWMRFEHDEEFRAKGGSYLQREFESGAQVFASSSELYSGVYVFDAYLAPLLGCLSPYVWGFFTGHTFGNVVQAYGWPLHGIDGQAAELLQTISIQGGADAVARPVISPAAYSAAVEWWAKSLNELFATLSDFSYFVDGDGFYAPANHMHTLLSVEQLFRRVVSMQVEHRDLHARRVLVFTVLDTLQRLTGRPIEKNCSLKFAQKTLDGLRSRMPPGAAEVLLPRAADSVIALKNMQEGFFFSKDRNSVRVQEESGAERVLNMDEAVAQYIKVLRDATHGHGSNRDGSVAKTNTLLAHHKGHVPHDLGWLGFLYLLDFLSRPDVFRNILRSRSPN